jgi:hypothetical protein
VEQRAERSHAASLAAAVTAAVAAAHAERDAVRADLLLLEAARGEDHAALEAVEEALVVQAEELREQQGAFEEGLERQRGQQEAELAADRAAAEAAAGAAAAAAAGEQGRREAELEAAFQERLQARQQEHQADVALRVHELVSAAHSGGRVGGEGLVRMQEGLASFSKSLTSKAQQVPAASASAWLSAQHAHSVHMRRV